ncbi:MAG: maltose transport system permease protein [Chloroflexota bacterium]|nr:maltose transport system permease protein [Chloroflexota bacterium]
MQKMAKKYYAFFTLPTLIAFVIAFLVPFILGIYLSFTKFTTVTNSEWVGISNYIHAFTDDENFLNAILFTAKFAVVSVVLINTFAFSLALLLTRAIKGTNIFRTVFFMPNLIGGIVLGYIWQLIINGILINFGVDITFSAKYGFWGLVVLMNWQMVGYMMIIYIAGIQSISSELIEAAEIDGANSWQILKSIKIPLVMPAVTICTFLTVTNSFKLFDQNLALTAGAPARTSSMIALDIFNTFYGSMGYEGVGQAKAVMFFLVVASIVLLQLRYTRSKETEA